MSRSLTLRAWAIGLLALGILAAQLAAAEKPAAELLPASTLVYIEVTQPKQIIGLLMDSPMRKELEKSPQYRQALQSPQFRQFEQAVGLVEQRAGVTWQQSLESITAGGIVAAFDPTTQGVVILSKSDNPKTTDTVRDALFSLARDDAKNKGNPDPVSSKTYRDLKYYTAGESVISDLGPWLMISNKPELAKSVADTFLDGGRALASDGDFMEARKSAGIGKPKAGVWSFVRLAPLRDLANLTSGSPLLDPANKSDNPALELLLGGLLPVIQKAPYLTQSVIFQPQGFTVAFTAPFDPSWVPASRRFFFAAQGGGAARPLNPKGTLLTLTTYRDIASFWQSAPDLFNEAVAAQLAQADSNLSTLFGGKSFSGDVLAAFKPQIQFVVARQDFQAAGLREPSIRLPGAALVFRVKEDQAANVKRHFRVGFQSIVAFANLDGSSKGRPLLEMKSEKRGNADMQYATYQPDEKDAAADQKPATKDDMYLNFSPALVMSRGTMILSSSKQLAAELADLVDKQGDEPPVIADNTLIEMNAHPIAELIRENRSQLIAQSMLEKGHDREQAEAEVNVLTGIVNYFGDAKIRLTPAAKSIRLEFDVKTASSPSEP